MLITVWHCSSEQKPVSYFSYIFTGSLGISDKNIEELKNVDAIEGVMPAYETDILVNYGSSQTVLKMNSLCDSAKDSVVDKNKVYSDDPNYLNRLVLTEGQWPVHDNECVLAADIALVDKPKIGDEVEILECTNGIEKTFRYNKFKVSGYVNSPYYVNIAQLGSSNLGKGIITDYAYVNSNFFKDDLPYTEAFLKVKGSENFIYGTDEYQQFIDSAMLEVSGIAPDLAQIRTSEIKSTAQEKLDQAKAEFQQQKQKANEELDTNEKKLNDA